MSADRALVEAAGTSAAILDAIDAGRTVGRVLTIARGAYVARLVEAIGDGVDGDDRAALCALADDMIVLATIASARAKRPDEEAMHERAAGIMIARIEARIETASGRTLVNWIYDEANRLERAADAEDDAAEAAALAARGVL